MCFCDTENCNTGTECNCGNDDNGLKCQVCSGDDGKCSGIDDLGESKTCQNGQVCAFIIQVYEDKTTYLRSCHEDLNQDCLIDSQEGVRIMNWLINNHFTFFLSLVGIHSMLL